MKPYLQRFERSNERYQPDTFPLPGGEDACGDPRLRDLRTAGPAEANLATTLTRIKQETTDDD